MKKQSDSIKILVVRFQRIGDAILASPICNSLKKSFPNSCIDYVLYEPASPIFKNHPYIDNVICISKKEQKNPFLYIQRIWKITRKKYDIVIDIMSTPKSELFTLFSLRSSYRIGRYKRYRGFTYTHKQKEPANTKNKVDKFLKQLLPPLEQDYQITYAPQLVLSVLEEEKDRMKEKMLQAGLSFEKSIVPFAVLSRVSGKTYPLDLMKQVLQHCLNHYDMQLVFFYSPDQKEVIKKLEDELGNPRNIFSNIETKDMRELMALFANSTYYIGNEGGPRHMAQALGLPCLAIFNPSAEKKEWLPWPSESNVGIEPNDLLNYHNMRKEEFVKLEKEEAFRLITVNYVTEKIDNFLKVISKKGEC